MLTIIPLLPTTAINKPVALIEVGELTLSGSILPDEVKNEAGNVFLSLLLIIYIAGCILCLCYVTLSVVRIGLIIKKGSSTKNGNGTKLILLDDTAVTPFSWMKYIVLSRSDYKVSGDAIITHEQAHIRLGHSYDLVIAQLCIITQWFNPAAWLLYRELQNIHEYEADDAVIRKGIDIKQYQLLLIKKAVGTRLYSMANSLNHSNLKKRITMMLQRKSNPWARLKYAFVLPLAATAVALFAQPEVSQPFDEISNAKVSHFALELSKNEAKNLLATDLPVIPEKPAEKTTPSEAAYTPNVNEINAEIKLSLPNEKDALMQDPGDKIFTIVEKDPEFPGGQTEMFKFIKENMKYPPIAIENGIQGRVFCEFVVEKDGSLSNVKITRGRDPVLDQEAVRVLQTLPKFKPGEVSGKPVRVLYSVPVLFDLDKATDNKPQTTPPPSNNNASDQQAVADDYVFSIVEKDPEYPGGPAALLKYIKENMKYPPIAKENGIEGRVFCKFIVEKDGSVSNVKITRGRDPVLDKEAVRILQTLPKFKPGEQRGQPVRTMYSVPVLFQINEKDNSKGDKLVVEEQKPTSPFKVYPSPANDVLYIDIDRQAIIAKNKTTNNPTCEIRLYNSSGVLALHTTSGSNKVQLNISKLPDGIYVVNLFDGTDSKPEVQQIVIKH